LKGVPVRFFFLYAPSGGPENIEQRVQPEVIHEKAIDELEQIADI
jgi:hypothetical protein